MPTHRIPRGRLHEDLQSLEREHEHVVSIVNDGDFFKVTTRYCGEAPERAVVEVDETR
jgi:hypothetical protein